MLADSQEVIDRFADALWLEDGLSGNTLAAYKRDLTLLARWLGQTQALPLLRAQEHHLRPILQSVMRAAKPLRPIGA
jgi:integrase/recombinase XerD